VNSFGRFLLWAPLVVPLFAAVLSPAAVATAGSSEPWLHIAVEGHDLDKADLDDVMRLTFRGLLGDPMHRIAGPKSVPKEPRDMPAVARMVWYAGKDASGQGLLWYADFGKDAPRLSNPQMAEQKVEQNAAGILAALDAGDGEALWRSIYAAVPSDAEHREQLGLEMANALVEYSVQSVAHSEADRKWIFRNITAGMTRADVYAALRAHDVHIGDPFPPVAAAPPASGPARVYLQGPFEPGCSFSRDITLTFDAADRLEKMDLGEDTPNCL